MPLLRRIRHLRGHRWRMKGHRTCPGCQRVVRLYVCRCGASRHDQRPGFRPSDYS